MSLTLSKIPPLKNEDASVVVDDLAVDVSWSMLLVVCSAIDGSTLAGVDSVENVKVTLIPDSSLMVDLSMSLAVVVSDGTLDETLE